MKVLNLVNPEKSEINYVISKFSDGQQQVTLKSISSILPNFTELLNEHIQIKSRLNNFKDLELIICIVKSLRELGCKTIHLYTPFFLGSRSDRKFEEGSNNYLKDVICPIINSLKLDSVTVLDPHSDVLEACLDNFKKKDNSDLLKRFLLNNYNLEEGFHEKFVLISPDAGANKKIFNIAKEIGFTGDIITCSKDRDVDGKLTRTVIPLIDRESHDFIIIDDICDGGRTFINIAKEIKKQYEGLEGISNIRIFLVVTHAIFSAGFEELNKYFDGIFCTNSYSDITELQDNNLVKTNVKQINIF